MISYVMKRLKVEPIPVPTKSKHPPPSNDVLPNHEFTLGLIAPKGCGKTTMICNLLKFYKGYFHTILVFSPTVASDEKWDYVKNLKLLAQNKPLYDWVKELQDQKTNNPVVPVRESGAKDMEGLVKYDEDFDGKIPEEHFFDDYNSETLEKILDEQMTLIKLLKKHGMTKHLANRMLIIFDDLVGSSLFTNARNNVFKGLNTRHRHYSCSMIMVSQGYKEIPKTVRTNWSCLIIFEIGNEKEIEVISEEFSLGMNSKQWMEAYQHCVGDEFGFMYINYQKPRRLRLMKNFDQVLFFQ